MRQDRDNQLIYSFILFCIAVLMVLVIQINDAFSQDIYPGESTTVRCLQPTPAPTPVPTTIPTPVPTPVPTATPAPAGQLKLTFSGSMIYSNGASDAAIFKTYANVMVQPWYANTSQSWCNYLRQSPTTVTVCMPYYDFGFQFTGDDACWNAAKQWAFANTYNLYGATSTAEAVMDYTQAGYLVWYKDVLTNGCLGTGTNKHMAKSGSGHNGMFLDNGIFDSSWVWNRYPVTAAQNKTNARAFLIGVRNQYLVNGDALLINAYSDMTATWANDTNFYQSVGSLVDYILFERTTTNLGSGAYLPASDVLNYINKAINYNNNSSGMVLWSTEYGNFWYNFVSGLMACTADKCGFWQQPAMSQVNIDKIKSMNIGIPVKPYTQAGCYYREFTNGYVVLNIGSASCNFVLQSGSYDDIVTNGIVSGTVSLGGNSGKIYRKR